MSTDLATIRRAGPHPALVLNADHRPLNLFPLEVWSWQEALHAVFNDRVLVVAEHDAVARSQRKSFRLPSVVALKSFVKTRKAPAFTRQNVLLRDRYACGYCGHSFQARELTYDHVVPASRGGQRRWENIISACLACNGRKADRTPSEAGMQLLWRPWKPSAEELHRAGVRFPPESIPVAWHDYLLDAA